MNRSRTVRRALWCALGGVALGVVGVAIDQWWHARQSEGVVGWREVLEAHSLIVIGVVVTFLSLALAARWVGERPRSLRVAVWVGLIAACADLLGQLWDNALHIGGDESEVAHGLSNVGAGVTFVAVLIALYLAHRRQAPVPDVSVSAGRSRTKHEATSSDQSSTTSE